MGMEINAARLAAMEQAPRGGRADPAAPDGDAAATFREAMREKPEGSDRNADRMGEGGGGDAATATTTGEEGLPSGEALLDSLFGRLAASRNGAESVAPAEAAPVSTETAELVDRLVDRILVSEPGRGQPEVRLTLGDRALPGTEVSISRSPDGQLTVRLTSTDPQSFQTLVGAQDSLRTALEQQGENVRIDVIRETASDDGDPNRRSRGYQQYHPDEE